MPHTRKTQVLLSLAMVAMLSACSDEPGPTAAPAPDDAALQQAIRDYPAEAELHRLAQRIPEFGGYSYVRGTSTLVVYVTNPGKADAARAAVQDVFSDPKRIGRAGRPVIEVRQARHSFAHLARWRDVAIDRLAEVAGATFVDIEEGNNRLAVGVADQAARSRVVNELLGVGIPESALVTVQDSTCEDASCEVAPEPEFVINPSDPAYLHSSPDNLRKPHRPAEAGMELSVILNNPTRERACTLGLNVTDQYGYPAIITAGHCSDTQGGYNGNVYYQPNQASTPSNEGPYAQEYHDPDWTACNTWFYRRNCRNSDDLLAFALVNSGAVGTIARPASWVGPGMGYSGTINIDTYTPRFTIRSLDDPVENEMIEKVGRTTGWSYGFVQRTCVSESLTRDPATNVRRLLRCQSRADYSAGGGDSGGPVFRWHMGEGSIATMLGTHWGRTSDSNGVDLYSKFSPISRIQADLGYFFIR